MDWASVEENMGEDEEWQQVFKMNVLPLLIYNYFIYYSLHANKHWPHQTSIYNGMTQTPTRNTFTAKEQKDPKRWQIQAIDWYKLYKNDTILTFISSQITIDTATTMITTTNTTQPFINVFQFSYFNFRDIFWERNLYPPSPNRLE